MPALRTESAVKPPQLSERLRRRTCTEPTTLGMWDRAALASGGAVIHVTVERTQRIESAVLKAALSDLAAFVQTLEQADEETLSFFWRTRNVPDRTDRLQLRKIVWRECMQRYEGLTNKPIKISLPYSRCVDARRVRARVVDCIRHHMAWPEFIRDWHIRRLRLCTSKTTSIRDILENVQHSHRHHHGCCCARVAHQMRAAGHTAPLPCVDGHIFILGREYRGPHATPLGVPATNVPRTTHWDI